MRTPILFLLLQCVLFAEVPKEFYSKVNESYYSSPKCAYENYEAVVEDRVFALVKERLAMLGKWAPFLPDTFENSFISKGSCEKPLAFEQKGTLSLWAKGATKRAIKKRENEIHREVTALNQTVMWFLVSPIILNYPPVASDTLISTDTGYTYIPDRNSTYTIYFDKQYKMTRWSKTVETKKGPIFTNITPRFQKYKKQYLISGYSVDVAFGKMTSDVELHYDFSGDIPLFKSISINNSLRGKKSSYELLFDPHTLVM